MFSASVVAAIGETFGKFFVVPLLPEFNNSLASELFAHIKASEVRC